jgi:hypothetical protein
MTWKTTRDTRIWNTALAARSCLSCFESFSRDQGRIRNTWRFDQTDATFRLPETLARLDYGRRAESTCAWSGSL